MKLADKALLVAALGMAFALPVFAQEDSSDLFADMSSDTAEAAAPAAAAPVAAPAETSFTLGLQGSHEFGYHMPAYSKSTFDYDSEMKSPYFSNEFDLSVQDKDVKFVSNWQVDALPLVASSDGESNGSWDKQVRARALENYVSWSPKGFKFSTGYQIFSWGVADKKNPTDNLNPRDYTVGVNADKIPVLAADAIWYPNDAVSVEGVFLPAAQKSDYPIDFAGSVDTNATTLSTLVSASLSAKYSTTFTVASEKSTYDSLELKPSNSIYGGKVNYRSSAFDASLSYLYDIDPLYTPVVTVTNTATYGRSVSIELKRERIHRIGLDAKTTVGKFGIWTEAAYDITESSGSDDYANRRSKLDYVVGTDVNFGPNDVGYINFQYIGTWIPGYDDSFYADLNAGKITDLSEIYQRALVESLGLDTEGLLQGCTTNLKYELADGAFTPQLTAVFAMPFNYDDTETKRYCSLALNPELDIKPVDSFHIKLGADLAYAWIKPAGKDLQLDTSTDKIGVYTPSNNVYIKILYKWNYDLKK
jgi:hypothetical protein